MGKKIICIILISMMITGCNKNKKEEIKKEEKPVYNENIGVTELKKIENLELELISLEYVNKVSTIKVRVTNKGKEKTKEMYINIKCIDEKGKEVITLLGYIKELKVNESTVIISNESIDLSKVEKVTYEKRK